MGRRVTILPPAGLPVPSSPIFSSKKFSEAAASTGRCLRCILLGAHLSFKATCEQVWPWPPYLYPSSGVLQDGLGRDMGGPHALTSVDDDVFGQVPHIHEGLATHTALVWSDVVMVTNVIGQLAGLDESTGPQITGS